METVGELSGEPLSRGRNCSCGEGTKKEASGPPRDTTRCRSGFWSTDWRGIKNHEGRFFVAVASRLFGHYMLNKYMF